MTNVPTDLKVNNQTRRSLPWWVTFIAFAALAGFLTMIALGMKRTQEGPITIGQTVPSFTLTLFDGQELSTADYAGKVIVVNFWASWCKPCESEAAELEQVWRMNQNSDQVIFLGVAWVDTEPESKKYLEKFEITYPNGPDLGTRIASIFRTTGVPETYVIDRNGVLAYVKKGPFLSISEIQSAVDPLLK